MSEVDVEVANGYFIQEPTWDNSIFSCFFNQKFFSCENSKKKLTFFKDRLFEIRQKIPVNELVKDKLFERILVTYFQSIDQYAKTNSSTKDKSFIIDLFSVFKEFIMYDDKNYFLNFFLLTVAIPVLNLIVQDIPTKEWYKKHLLSTFNFILKQQTKKNRTLYTNMMESDLVLKLLDNLYSSTDVATQFKILETVKLTCWKKELLVDLEYYFPRNQTLQEKFKNVLTTGKDRDFINTFNELNKNIRIYSIMVETVLLGNKFLNSDDDDFYLDINWEAKTMTLFVNPLCFYDSPPSFSQDSQGNYKIKFVETICVPFDIIDSIDNSYTKKDSKILYYIDVKLNGPCEYELETSKHVVDNSKRLKIITKPVLQTYGVILERYFQKYFQGKHKFGKFSSTGRTDCLNINIHKVYSANSSLVSEPSTSFLNNVNECENMFVKTSNHVLNGHNLAPVIEEEINNGLDNISAVETDKQHSSNIHETTIITEDAYERFTVTGNREKDTEKNKVWALDEIQINSISSNGISKQLSQENGNDKCLSSSSNKRANLIDDLLYGRCSQINDSIFNVFHPTDSQPDKENSNTKISSNKSNSPKVKVLTPIDLNERYEILNSQKNGENDDVISNSCSEESFHAKHLLKQNKNNQIVKDDTQSNNGNESCLNNVNKNTIYTNENIIYNDEIIIYDNECIINDNESVIDIDENVDVENDENNDENCDRIVNNDKSVDYDRNHDNNVDVNKSINENENINDDDDQSESNNYDSDAESVVSTKSFKHHDFKVDTKNILSRRLRNRRQKCVYDTENSDDDICEPDRLQRKIPKESKKINKRGRKKNDNGHATDMEYEIDIEKTVKRSYRRKNEKKQGYVSDTESIISVKSTYRMDKSDDECNEKKSNTISRRSRRKSVTEFSDEEWNKKTTNVKHIASRRKTYNTDEETDVDVSKKVCSRTRRRKSVVDYTDTECDEVIPKRKYTRSKNLNTDNKKCMNRKQNVSDLEDSKFNDAEDTSTVSKPTKNTEVNEIPSENEYDQTNNLQTVFNKKSNRNKYVSSDSEKEVCRGFKTDEETISTKNKNNVQVKKLKVSHVEKNEADTSEKCKLNINGTVCNVKLDNETVKDLKQKQLQIKLNTSTEISKFKNISSNNQPISKMIGNKKKCSNAVSTTENQKKCTDIFQQSSSKKRYNKFQDIDLNKTVTLRGTKRKLFNPKEENFEYYQVKNDETTKQTKTLQNSSQNEDHGTSSSIIKNKKNIKSKTKTKSKQSKNFKDKHKIAEDEVFNKLKNNEDNTSPLKSQRTKSRDRHNKIITVYESLFGAGDATQSVQGSCPNLSVSPLFTMPIEMELLHKEIDIDDIQPRGKNDLVQQKDDEQISDSVILQITPSKSVNPRKTSTPYNSDFEINPVYETFAKTLNIQNINLKEEEICACSKRGAIYSNVYVSSLMFKQSFKDYIMCNAHDASEDENKIKKRHELYNELIQHIDFIMDKIDNECR